MSPLPNDDEGHSSQDLQQDWPDDGPEFESGNGVSGAVLAWVIAGVIVLAIALTIVVVAARSTPP